MDSILLETLRRIETLYPNVTSAYLDDLELLPLTVEEIASLPDQHDMLPFPHPNPSSSTYPAEASWAVPARFKVAVNRDWSSILADNEGIFCPLPSCREYDCELHGELDIAHLCMSGSMLTCILLIIASVTSKAEEITPKLLYRTQTTSSELYSTLLAKDKAWSQLCPELLLIVQASREDFSDCSDTCALPSIRRCVRPGAFSLRTFTCC